LKPVSQHTVIGASMPRRDIPPKVSGTPIFVHDLHFEGMLHGRVVRPPSYGARLVEFDAPAVQGMPGVTAVVRDGKFSRA
jgi:CO/xanthine dehydrogenase Mo-binding subunit